MKKSVAWSYSALTAFESCPKRFFHTRVKKDVPDPPGEEAMWGQRVHSNLEQRLKSGTPLPPSLVNFEPYAAKLAGAPGILLVEQQIALTKEFKVTEWFAEDVWVRSVLDVAILNGTRAGVWDWKTGKRKPENEQLKLFAGVAFCAYPSVHEVSTGFIWLKEKKMDRETFSRDAAHEIWQEFLPRVHRLERAYETDTWDAKPSGLCRRHCPVKSCVHNGLR